MVIRLNVELILVLGIMLLDLLRAQYCLSLSACKSLFLLKYTVHVVSSSFIIFSNLGHDIIIISNRKTMRSRLGLGILDTCSNHKIILNYSSFIFRLLFEVNHYILD